MSFARRASSWWPPAKRQQPRASNEPVPGDVRGAAEQAITDALEPPPPVDDEKWATENVSFSDRESQFTGPYNPSRFRPFTEIYKALSPADPCR